MDDWHLTTPTDCATAYCLIREALAAVIIGHDAAVSALALAGTRHLVGIEGQRLVLIGPSGSGKSTLARTLATTLGVPWRIIDVTMLAEQNWTGPQITDHLDALFSKHGSAANRAVLLLDEIDKICVEGMERVSKDYRIGKQQTLLPLVGVGSELPLPGFNQCKPDGMLIIMAGVFAGITAHQVGPADMLRAGLMAEIVERMGPLIRLHAPSRDVLVEVLRRSAARCAEAFRLFGYSLEVPEETLRYVAAAVASDAAAGPRTGMSWLQGSADALLVKHLEQGSAEGTRIMLNPDSITLPTRTRVP